MWVAFHEQAILECARFHFIGIGYHVPRARRICQDPKALLPI